MCGIVGVVAKGLCRSESALDALAHRGPDGRGDASIGNVWLGHQRLSIIDLSAAAAQPMCLDACGTLIFNGEIFDYDEHRRRLEQSGETFHTRSDTEVLLRGLHRRGPDFLKAVHAMFAFAWLEPSGRRLWLGRDHAGIKPLYIWAGPQGLAFASEVRALAAAVRSMGGSVRLSTQALASLLRWGAVEEPDTILEGVHAVPPDALLEIDTQRLEIVRTHVIGRIPSSARVREDADVEACAAAIKGAVQRHIVADVPVALFLSGGIDSGVLAAELSDLACSDVRAIHVDLGTKEAADEGAIVRRMASRYGLQLEAVGLTEWHSRIADALAAYDQPSVDGLNTFLIAGAASALGYKVALSGVGADEVFGGYRHHHRRLSWLERSLAVRVVGRSIAPALFEATALRARRAGSVLESVAAGSGVQRSFRAILPPSIVARLMPEMAVGPSRPLADDPLLLDQQTYLRNTLLRDADVMGMAHGVEIRAPFLDPDVLAAARGVGTHALLDPAKPPKWILREVWNDRLDRATLTRRKSGFTLNLSAWFRGPGRPYLEDSRTGLASSAFIDARALEKVWRALMARLQAGHTDAWAPLLALIQTEQQFRRWGEPS